MINVLPPELKQQVKYSKRNIILLRHLLLTLSASALIAAIIFLSLWYSSRQITSLQTSLQERQQERESYKDTETKVQALQSSLNLIDKLLTERTEYSAVLGDLAAVLPTGSYISSMTLTGEDDKPMQMIVFADSINTAGLIRNSLLTSPRINSADIQSITRDDENNVFSVDIIVAFEKGQAQ